MQKNEKAAESEELKLKAGIVKACAGIVESAEGEPWTSYIRAAEEVVGRNYAQNDRAQRTRAALVEAVKLNLINRKAYPFELLVRRFGLPIDQKTFAKEKYRFCHKLAQLSRLIG